MHRQTEQLLQLLAVQAAQDKDTSPSVVMVLVMTMPGQNKTVLTLEMYHMVRILMYTEDWMLWKITVLVQAAAAGV